MTASSSFLKRAKEEGDSFLYMIIMMNDSMFNLFDPEMKMESSVWKRAASPPLL